RRQTWVWLVTGVPCVWMYAMSSWALYLMTWPKFKDPTTGGFVVPQDPVPWIGVVLLTLAALMLVEAVIALAGDKRKPSSPLPIGAVPAAGS
ncbi:MAG: hypothetical protein K2X38_21015, partial [Gemmataceae bacterium]|nr:hypothetical protein [Gemmataceae bacterium]